jgi:hypothetical protein
MIVIPMNIGMQFHTIVIPMKIGIQFHYLFLLVGVED